MRLKIAGVYFHHFDDVVIQLSLDSVASSFSILTRFNPENETHRSIFKPLTFPKIEIFNNDNEIILTGRIVSHLFNATANPELIKISGYSLGGVLEDVSIPYSSYPLESIKRSLRDISQKLLGVFGIGLVIDSSVKNDVDLIYEKSVAEPSESVKSYLSKLTAQRNIVLSHDSQGNIVMFRPNIDAQSKYFFNDENTVKISLSVNGQGLHSEISVIRQPSINNTNISPVDTVNNSMVTLKRTKVKVLSSGTDTDTKNAANNELAAQLKNIPVKVILSKVINIKPGDIVEVQSIYAYLYNRTRFMVQAVSIKENRSSSNTELSLVLPETYTGDSPKNIFQ